MRKLDYSDFLWKGNELYDPSGICWGEIVPSETPKMWKIHWIGNGEFSTDHWNKTHAKDNFIKMAQFLNNTMVDNVLTPHSEPQR